MKLLQSQKNKIYELIEDAGLSPNMFELDESTRTTQLSLKDSNYYYKFMEGSNGGHYATYSPGLETLREEQYPGNWVGQTAYVHNWLKYLNRELNSPDKWKLLQEELENIDFSDINYENTKFTYQEYSILEKKIDELKTKVSKLDLLEDQIKQINIKLDHLLNLAKDMNKTDWKELFIGSILSLIMQLSIDKSTGQVLFGYIKSLFVIFLPVR